MSENEGGSDSKFMTGFLVGFVVGVLVCLGVGGTLVVVKVQRQREAAMMEAMRARDALVEAEMQRRRADEEQAQAREALRRAQKAEAERKDKAAVPPAGKKEGE